MLKDETKICQPEHLSSQYSREQKYADCRTVSKQRAFLFPMKVAFKSKLHVGNLTLLIGRAYITAGLF